MQAFLFINAYFILQPEQKESGHTPEMTGPHCTKEIPINKKPQLRKIRSQDLHDKHHPEHQKVSETRVNTQEAFSKTSKVETITCKSTFERREEMHTTFSHTHTVSHSPAERDKRSCSLQQPKRDFQDTTPPPPPPRDPGLSRPGIRDIQKVCFRVQINSSYGQKVDYHGFSCRRSNSMKRLPFQYNLVSLEIQMSLTTRFPISHFTIILRNFHRFHTEE